MKKLILTFLFFAFTLTALKAQTINAPSNLEAEPENFSYIKVKWDDNSNNEQGFNIERSYTNDTNMIWETIGSVTANEEEFLDYWVTNNVIYYYRVYAFSGSVRSPYSNIAYCTASVDTNTHPRAPSNLKVTNTTPVSITIGWNDNSENELGFIIARRVQGELLFQYIDTVEADVLTYQEMGLTPDNVYFYKVCAYNVYGLSDFTNTVSARAEKGTGVISNISELPSGYFLGNNYPNPFNPSTTIKFGISARSFVKLNVYNSLGLEVGNLVNQSLNPGTYDVKWNAVNLASGIYYYKFETGNFTETRKMILTK